MSDDDRAWSREPDPDADTVLGPAYDQYSEAWSPPCLDYPETQAAPVIVEERRPGKATLVAAAGLIAGVFGLGLGLASLIRPSPPVAAPVAQQATPPLVKTGPPVQSPLPQTVKPSLTPLPEMPPLPGEDQGMSDDEFMVETLRAAGLTIKDRAGVIQMGHNVCAYLGDHTKQQTIDDMYRGQQERWDKPSRQKVSAIVETSMLAYCPQYVQGR